MLLLLSNTYKGGFSGLKKLFRVISCLLSIAKGGPIARKWETSRSLVWKHMMRNKFKVEPYIQWKIIFDTSYFLWDD